MKTIRFRKAFAYVCAFLLTICALLAFAFMGEKPVKNVQTAEAATFSQLSGHPEWSISASEGTVVSDAQGCGWRSAVGYKLMSTKKCWVDKFGIEFYCWKPSGNFRVIMAPDGSKWYEEQSKHVALEINYTGSSSASVGIFVNGQGVALLSGFYIGWDNNLNNELYLNKLSSGGWVLGLGGSRKDLDSTTNNKLNEVLSSFPERVGYIQIQNVTESMEFRYKATLFGVPVSAARPSSVASPILSEPNWVPTSDGEVVAWSPKRATEYTVGCSTPIAFKGLDVTLRMAPANGITRNIIAFTSLYKHNWYTGTYTISFNFDYNPAAHGDQYVNLQFMVYTPTTEATKIEPIKIGKQVPFKWYGENRFEFFRYKGEWVVELNGEAVFEGLVSGEGKTINDYMNEVAPYYEDNKAYLQMWGRGDGINLSSIVPDGFVVKSMKAASAVTSDININHNITNFQELSVFEFQTNIQVRVKMSDLFSVTGTSNKEYFATMGKMQSNGVWAYTARGVGKEWITFKCIAGGKEESYRVQLTFIQGPEVVAPAAASQDVSFAANGEMSVGTWTESTTNVPAIVAGVVAVALVAVATVATVLVVKKRREE